MEAAIRRLKTQICENGIGPQGTDHLIRYRFIQVEHLSISSEQVPHDLHLFIRGSIGILQMERNDNKYQLIKFNVNSDQYSNSQANDVVPLDVVLLDHGDGCELMLKIQMIKVFCEFDLIGLLRSRRSQIADVLSHRPHFRVSYPRHGPAAPSKVLPAIPEKVGHFMLYSVSGPPAGCRILVDFLLLVLRLGNFCPKVNPLVT